MKPGLPSMWPNLEFECVDPRSPLVLILPSECVANLTVESVALTSEARRWMVEHTPSYKCLVVPNFSLTVELKEIGIRMAAPAKMGVSMPFVEFDNDIEALHFKMRFG